MVVRRTLGDADRDHDRGEERRDGKRHALAAEIGLEVEGELVAAGAEGLAREERRRAAPVGVGDGLHDRFAAAIDARKLDRHARGRHAVVGIQHVSR